MREKRERARTKSENVEDEFRKLERESMERENEKGEGEERI